MYNHASTEQYLVFAKIHPFINQIREYFSSPYFMKNLEALIKRIPDAEARLKKRREIAKEWADKRAKMEQTA